MKTTTTHVLDPTGKCLHAEAARLREQGNAVQVELPGGVVAWSINDHDTIKGVLSNPLVTKSARAHWPAFANGEVPPDWELISWVAMDNMVTSYGKNHVRLRKLVGKAFTPRRTEAIRPRVEELTDQLLGALQVSAERGEVVDLRENFAYPLPARIVADLIGMEEAERVATAKVIDMMVDTTVSPEQAQATLAGWRDAMSRHIKRKTEHPGEDITSDLIAARADGTSLSEVELTDTIFAILGAGSETTINFFDNAITALLSHPEQLEAVRSGRRTWDDVIDEVLRYQSPLAHLPLRYAVDDLELGGVSIRKGDPILVNYAAVGRDPALHGEGADEFDLDRESKDHLSFGHGPHYCLGAGIARMVATVGLSTLFERYPEVTLAASVDSLQPLPTFIMNGHQSLPVRLGSPAGEQ